MHSSTNPAASSPSSAQPEARIDLPRGLPGFPGLSHASIAPLPAGNPRYFRLTNADGPMPAFILAVQLEAESLISAADLAGACQDLGFEKEDVAVFFIVAAEPGSSAVRLCINRRAPLFIDVRRHLAFQHVLPRPDYHTREPLPLAVPG